MVRGWVAMDFTARVLADASSHSLVGTVEGGELRYMKLASEREQLAYSSVLMRSGAVLADHKPMRYAAACIATTISTTISTSTSPPPPPVPTRPHHHRLHLHQDVAHCI